MADPGVLGHVGGRGQGQLLTLLVVVSLEYFTLWPLSLIIFVISQICQHLCHDCRRCNVGNRNVSTLVLQHLSCGTRVS